MNAKSLIFLFSRYIILVALALGNLFIFYFIFTPLTYFTSLWFLKIFYAGNLAYGSGGFAIDAGNLIAITSVTGRSIFATIIPACVAGAAYYLLTILNLSTPMKFSKRIMSLIFLLGVFLIFNTIRIIIFLIVLIKGNTNFFDIAHSASWYFGSTAFVVLIWFANVLIFRIRTIPVFTDLKSLFMEAIKTNGSK